MKQSYFCWTEEEYQVAEILLDLGNSVPVPESRNNLSWGGKRRRSNPYFAPTPSLPSPGTETETETEIQSQVKLEPPSKSPTTPLSFSPSESDEKSKYSSSKNSKKRKYMEMIEGLTQRRDLLRREVENVGNYYKKLKAYNLELKLLMKQKAVINEGSHTHMGISKFLNFEMNSSHHHQITAVAHQQPFNLDPMATGPSTQISEKIHCPSSNGLCHINRVGPVGIPDLNLSPEEAFGVEPSYLNRDLADKRARFAEARRLRRGIIKIKSMKSQRSR